MPRKQTIFRTMRRRLLARTSSLAVRVALRPPGWAPGLLAVGLIGAPAPALAQEIIDLASDAEVTIEGAAFNDRSGTSVSGAGDVNGDGLDDLIIGTPRVDSNGRTNVGASYLVFGTDRGFPATIDLATDADVIIQGAADRGFSGETVSGAGDVNGDGIDDLIIGAPSGVSNVVFGTDQGFPATIDLASDADLTLLSSGFEVSGAGDVNGDGIDDLIIGDPFANPNGRFAAGASYLVFGRDKGFPAVIDLATDADVTLQGAAYDLSGSSVSGAGDVNGDGIDDLIIGAYGANPNGRVQAGASYVVFGRDQGFPATIDLSTDADLIIQGAAENDRSGSSVSGAGDVDGDGIDDLIVGGGVSNVVFGTDQGFPATIDLASDADLTLLGGGSSVSGAGDFNGDGIDDLIIGAAYADPNGRYAAGASYVVFGRDQGFPATIDLASDADLTIQGAAPFDISGSSVSGAGDVDGDGIDDLIIGAPGNTYSAGAGASYVVFGSGPAAAIEDLIAAVEAAGLKPRIEKILTKTLNRALDSLNKGKESRAIFALRLFIIEVKALRGKKIEEADADEWIADARAIIDTLKAQRDRHRKPRHHAPSPMVEARE